MCTLITVFLCVLIAGKQIVPSSPPSDSESSSLTSSSDSESSSLTSTLDSESSSLPSMHSLSSTFTSSSESDDYDGDSDSPHVIWKSALHTCSFLEFPQDGFCGKKGYLEQRRYRILNCGLKELCRILFFSSLHIWVSLSPKSPNFQLYDSFVTLDSWWLNLVCSCYEK